ncbi:hypothetical protein NEOLEDRAFT_1134698 [Neolentinus lepideus HHB14362 ss-1]|uniref:Uncharacterized protein n=1 Tax=Neolentinus lepideus HHB14362 ss-1 TaxID=1314782 RepID=A0A165S4E5_9AGAM|nr:hypothetical protein NEOLEDRAFT_1134698 [Neolentinus lepideus HHB14362 ss-1]
MCELYQCPVCPNGYPSLLLRHPDACICSSGSQYSQGTTTATSWPLGNVLTPANEVLSSQPVPHPNTAFLYGETDTSRHSRLLEFMFEVLQILKYLYCHEQLDFAADWVANGADLQEVFEPPEEQV